MRRRVLLCLTLAIASGCQGGDFARPTFDPNAPTRIISDGSHSNGNPDFFFLPPVVGNANQSRNWDATEFRGDLSPVVTICELASASASCGTVIFNQTAGLSGGDKYQINWKVPRSSVEFYRLEVSATDPARPASPPVTLGRADVQTEPNGAGLKNVNTGEFVALVDGSTLPIKFRIEQHALETFASGPINLALGGTVSVGSGNDLIGVTFPPGNSGGTVDVSVSHCDDLNPRALDLPVFGPCVRVRTDPDVGILANPATVFACGVNFSNLPEGSILNPAQAERLTLHRLDGSGAGQTITALQHAPACGAEIGSADGSVKGMFAALRRGQFRSAARELASVLGPKPAYAFFIDLGGGGFTDGFSDFQFALPASFASGEGGFSLYGQPGTTIDGTVEVRDVGRQPVRGVRVHFTAREGSVTPPDAVSDANGVASTRWSLGATTPAHLVASGRGVGGTDFNGPRDWLDPFQPIHSFFDGGTSEGGPVLVRTGSVTISTYYYAQGVGVRTNGAKYLLATATAAARWRSLVAPTASTSSRIQPRT